MSSSRARSQTTKPNGSIPRGGRLLSLIFALSRNPNRLPPRTHKKERLGVESKFFDTTREAAGSLDGVNGMSDPSTQRYTVASIDGPSSPRDESVRLADRTSISDEGRSERARAASEFQIAS